MIRKLLAIIIGLVVAGIIVMLIQKLGHSLYPPPAGMDLNDQAFMTEYVASLPWGPLAFVLASYFAATLAGGWIAASIAGQFPLAFAGTIGAIMLAGAIWNVYTIPHPPWFTITAIAVIVVASLLAAGFASRRSTGIRAV